MTEKEQSYKESSKHLINLYYGSHYLLQEKFKKVYVKQNYGIEVLTDNMTFIEIIKAIKWFNLELILNDIRLEIGLDDSFNNFKKDIRLDKPDVHFFY